jgi:hypothetical protein
MREILKRGLPSLFYPLACITGHCQDIIVARRDKQRQTLLLTPSRSPTESSGSGGLLRGDVAKWLRRGSAKPLFTGSNPVVASKSKYEIDGIKPSVTKNC